MSTLRELVAKWREYGERSIMQEAYTALGEARGYRNCATELEAVAEEGSNNNAKEELDAIDELCGPRQPDDATSVFCRISHKLRAAAPSLHKEGLPECGCEENRCFGPITGYRCRAGNSAAEPYSTCGECTFDPELPNEPAALHKEGERNADLKADLVLSLRLAVLREVKKIYDDGGTSSKVYEWLIEQIHNPAGRPAEKEPK